jgi:hypothetical protein
VTGAGSADRGRPGNADRTDVAEEVARLTEALAGWWTSVTAGSPAEPVPPVSRDSDRNDPVGRGPAGGAHDGHQEHHERPTSSCRVCPVCRALDLARGARPDLLEKLALAAEAVALLLREATGDRRAGPVDVPQAAEAEDTDEADPFRRGTPIVVTDGDVPSTAPPEQQEGRTAWA